MKIVMMPDYRRDNPYQELLRIALAKQGCEVIFPVGYRRVFPLWRAVRSHADARVLHLHWTPPFVRRSGPLFGWIYSLKLLIDVLLVRLSGRRVVWTMHNLIPHDHPYPRRERWMRSWLCRLSSAVIVHSENGRREAVEQLGGDEGRIAAIPHGHYRHTYGEVPQRTDARRALDLAIDSRVFLQFGILRPYKGIERLLRIWRAARLENSVLLIVGGFQDDAYRLKIEQLAGETPGVRLIAGHVPDEEVPRYFAAADAAVLPFERIQTSGSVLLAMSFDVPVIAPRLGDVPESTKGADDLLFAPGDDDDLQRQLAAAATCDLTPLRERTRTACERFGWDAIGAATAQLYRKVCTATDTRAMAGTLRCDTN